MELIPSSLRKHSTAGFWVKFPCQESQACPLEWQQCSACLCGRALLQLSTKTLQTGSCQGHKAPTLLIDWFTVVWYCTKGFCCCNDFKWKHQQLVMTSQYHLWLKTLMEFLWEFTLVKTPSLALALLLSDCGKANKHLELKMNYKSL